MKKENLKCNTIIDKSRVARLILEFNKVIGPLTNPKQYGLDDSICFDLVMPSIRFCFSSAPKYPYGPRKIATYYDKLMTKILNYDSYYAQGGDWGGAISTWLGYDHYKNCKGIHLNIMIVRDKNGPQDEAEKRGRKDLRRSKVLKKDIELCRPLSRRL